MRRWSIATSEVRVFQRINRRTSLNIYTRRYWGVAKVVVFETDANMSWSI